MNRIKNVVTGIILTVFLPFCIWAQVKESFLYVKAVKEELRTAPNGDKMAEVLQSIEMKLLEEKDKWVKVQITGWILKSSTTNDKTEIDKLKVERKNIVEFVNYKILKLPADYSRDSKPYGSHVRAHFQFRNNSNKTLTGLIYKVEFLDSFGDVLYKITSVKHQLKISPEEVNPIDAWYWYWEDNQYINDEPYDKLHAAASAGTIKVRVTIQKAAFNDGTVVEFDK
jgi:hypothetical protein